MYQNFKKEVTENTTIWTSDLDIVLPINGSDIKGFEEWVNWSGWKGYSDKHLAFDFASYLSTDGKCVIGLPEETPVRAIADGIVVQISRGLTENVPYATFINVEHGKPGSGLFSAYHHVVPIVKQGQEVKKGEVIATLYKDEGNEIGRLVHLHFMITHGWNVKDRYCNPEEIYPLIAKYRAEPQGSLDCKIAGLEKQPKIYIANFKEVTVNTGIKRLK